MADAAAQGTELFRGDVLLIRCGFVQPHNEASEAGLSRGTVHGSELVVAVGAEKSVEWFGNHHFAVVGGDASIFEASPAEDERYREPLLFQIWSQLEH